MKTLEKNNSLTKLAGIYMLGNFSSKLLSFLLVFGLTYFLSKEDIGKYDLIITTIALVVSCVTLQIDSAVLRWLLDDSSEEKRRQVFKNVFHLIFINITIYTVLFILFLVFSTFKYAIYIYIYSILQVLLPVLQQGIRGIGKNKIYAYSGVIYSFLYVSIALITLFLFKKDIQSILIANILAVLIIILYLFKKGNFYVYFSFKDIDYKFIKELISYSLPLLPNSLSWWLVISATRYIILYYLGISDNGIFAISYKYPTIVMLLSNIFNLAWQEKAIKSQGSKVDNEKEYSKILETYVKFLMTTIIVLSCLSKILITTLVAPAFVEAWKYMPILLYAVTLQAIVAFYGAGYLSSKKTGGAVVSSLIGAVVTVVSCVILIQFWGLYGVSASILLGFSVMLVVRILHVRSMLAIQFPVKTFTFLTICFILLSMSNYYTNNILFLVSLFLSVIIFIKFNYAELQKISIKIFK